jgi:hypothetical protein
MVRNLLPESRGMKGRNLPETVLSRCIVIELKRKLSTEKAESFSHQDTTELQTIRRMLARWADDSRQILARAAPEMPEGLQQAGPKMGPAIRHR